MDSWVLTLVQLEWWGVGEEGTAAASETRPAAPLLLGGGGAVSKGQQPPDPRAEAHLLKCFLLLAGIHPSVLQTRKCRPRDVDSSVQGHTARVARGHRQRPLPPHCFLGLTRCLTQGWSLVNIYCSNAESKTETLTGRTAS